MIKIITQPSVPFKHKLMTMLVPTEPSFFFLFFEPKLIDLLINFQNFLHHCSSLKFRCSDDKGYIQTKHNILFSTHVYPNMS